MNGDRRATTHPSIASPTDAVGLWRSELGHLIQDVAREERLGGLSSCAPRSKSLADDRFVPEEGVLRMRLLMVPRHLLPLTPSERPHALVVLDGQHRLTALKKLIEKGGQDVISEIDLGLLTSAIVEVVAAI